MFEKLYKKDRESVNKNDFNLLYEEYQKLLKNYTKLEKQSFLIIKQSDRHIFKNMSQIELYEKEKSRFYSILRQSDTQGKTLLKKTYNLEEKLEIEFEYEEELLEEITATQKEVIFTMGAIGESRSKETGNHVRRVAEYSKFLALYYGISPEDAELLKNASPMHDIGKVGIPDVILNKPSKLNNNEWKIMQTHAELGYEMLKHSQRAILKAASIVAIEHHEKWDGTGYPNALQGEDIHIYGRITALADVFDALGSRRCYKEVWKDEDIFAFFKKERGKHFDPSLVDIFFHHLDKFLEIRDRLRD